MANLSRRTFLAAGMSGATTLTRRARAQSVVDALGIGVIGCGGRGNELIEQIKSVAGVEIVALCDPDSARTAAAAKDLPNAKTYVDLRRLLDDPAVQAVVIAACNHWHCLAAVWACEAGKDVYCEKPLSHALWEGRQLIAAARDHDRIVAVGTQQRSDPVQDEIKDFLHEQHALGKIQSVVVPRFGVRASIGKRTTPLAPPETLDYDIWVGPAQDELVFRNQWHYDWHWSWNTGNGECGNWGVHLLDDVVNVVFRDQHKLPDRVCSGGARVVWNDAGQSPNLHLAYLEAGEVPVMFALSNLPAKPAVNTALRFDDVESGYVVLCEGGAYRGWRGGGTAVDAAGKTIRDFRGDAGAGHMQNFVDAVRQRRREILHAPVEIGHSSAGWAHVINAAYRTAETPGLAPPDDAIRAARGFDTLQKVMSDHLVAHGLNGGAADFHTSPLMEIEVEAERFSGPGSQAANVHLGRPAYRGPFALPA